MRVENLTVSSRSGPFSPATQEKLAEIEELCVDLGWLPEQLEVFCHRKYGRSLANIDQVEAISLTFNLRHELRVCEGLSHSISWS